MDNFGSFPVWSLSELRKLVELLSTAVKKHAGERPFKALKQSRMRRVIIQNYLIKPHEHAACQLCQRGSNTGQLSKPSSQ